MRKPRPYRCRDRRKDFSVKTWTLMHHSRLGLRVWAAAIYLLVTNLKGISGMKLHRSFGIRQKRAWYSAHRIRETLEENKDIFCGSVEVDESYFAGKYHNMHQSEKASYGRGWGAG